MENYDYEINASDLKETSIHETQYDIPEPIDQWAVEDFEQFASLIVNTE